MAGVADVGRGAIDPSTGDGPNEGGRDGPEEPKLSRDDRTLDEDELFDVLSNRRRRYAVHLLEREDGPIELGEMAEQIAAWENEIECREVNHAQRKRVYTALQQSHLPRMDDADIVVFDDRSGTVTPTSNLDQLSIYVDIVRRRDLPWSGYYLALSVISLVTLIAAWADVWLLTTLPDIAWGIFVVVTVSVFALAHHFYMTRQQLGFTEKPPELEYR